MKSDHLLKLTSDFGLKICQTNCGIHVVFKSEINHLQKNVPAPKTTSPSATKTDGIQYDLKHIHHEIKPCKTLINNPTKKTTIFQHLPTFPVFFLMVPKLLPLPPTRTCTGFMETRNCGFRYHDNMGALVFERPPPMNKLKGRSWRLLRGYFHGDRQPTPPGPKLPPPEIRGPLLRAY